MECFGAMKIKKIMQGATPVLEIEGSLSAEVVFQFEKEVDRHIADKTSLVLDFSKVTFVDSAALGSLLRCVSLFRKQGRLLLISGVNDHILSVFRLTGFTDKIQLYDTPQRAIEFLQGE